MPQEELEIRLMREIASHLAMPIWLAGPDGRLLYYNKPAELILGKRFEESAAGGNSAASEITQEELASVLRITADDGSSLDPADRPMSIALTQQRPAHLPMRMCGLDGVWRRIEVTAFPLEGQRGRLLGAVAIFWEKTSIDAVAAVVESDRPDLRPHAAPDGTVTLLFSDIEDSTPLNQRLGDQRWMALLREHNALVQDCLQAHGGSKIKHTGDGFMLAFSSARRALQCAIAIQRAFAQRNEEAEEPVRVRIGLHTGEAVQEAGDFFGKHVVQAARIGNEANGGEILVSSLLKELTESGGDISFGKGRAVELKGLGEQRVHEVAWEQG